jgi:hypothetical protein
MNDDDDDDDDDPGRAAGSAGSVNGCESACDGRLGS